MVQIIEQGTIPTPEVPWYLSTVLVCPNCETKFRLDAADMESTGSHPDERAAWGVVTERKPDGRQIVSGPCPFCKRPVRIERGSQQQTHLLAKAAATGALAEVRASLPAQITAWRWVKESTGHVWKVGAVPIGPNGIIVADGHRDRVHVITRQDGQIRTDITAPIVAIGGRWMATSEPEAARLDMELVEFVQRLGLVSSALPSGLNGGY